MRIVESAHIRLHGTRLRIHTHEAGTQERLHVAYTVYRHHHGVDVAVIGEERHLSRRMERAVYLLLACACRLKCTIAFALKHSTFHNLVNLLLRERRGERSVRLALLLLEELGLQEACYVSIHSLLGISLHTRIDSGVHLQAVGVEVVRRTVLLAILVAPSVKRIAYPSYRVDDILALVPRRIVGTLRTLGRHVHTQELAQVRRYAILVVGAVEVERERRLDVLRILGIGDIARLAHLVEHHVATLATTVGITHGIEQRRVLAQADERSSLLNIKVARLLIKIGIGRSLYTYSVMQEVEIVEIQSYNLLFGVVALELHGDNPLYRFLQRTLHGALGGFGIELLGKLLRDGRTATGRSLTEQTALDDGSAQSDEVYARMVVETHILCSHKRLHQVWRDVVV